MTGRSFVSTLTGSFSQPAAGNPTVAMVEAAYRHHGLDARYLNCDVAPDDLPAAVAGAAATGWVGFNCSLPHKVSVIDLLDDLEPSARLVGAVNCVIRRDGRWVGSNTDGRGFVESLRPVRDPAGASVVVLGAGGAARAVAVESALAGAATVTVVSRHQRPGAELVRLVTDGTAARARHVPWDGDLGADASAAEVLSGADVLVNATSVGFGDPDARPAVDLGTVPSSCVVADVVANPPRTRFLREAAGAGLRTLDGLGMLVGQGALAIRAWTGLEPDRAVMREALERALA